MKAILVHTADPQAEWLQTPGDARPEEVADNLKDEISMMKLRLMIDKAGDILRPIAKEMGIETEEDVYRMIS